MLWLDAFLGFPLLLILLIFLLALVANGDFATGCGRLGEVCMQVFASLARTASSLEGVT